MVAYKYKTFDYIAKPITTDRLEDTIKRLFEDANELTKHYLKIDNKNTLIDEAEVQFIKRDGMKLVFCTDTRTYETYSSFKKIKDCLPENFVRCHKSYIVNIDKISHIQSNNTIFFKDNKNIQCKIGPKYENLFLGG